MIEKPNYKDIFDSWVTSFKPNETQKKLANERLEVCLGCEFRNELIKNNTWSAYCGKCSCPINKKIFSKLYNSCPLKLWKEVDSKHMDILEDKIDKTLI